MNYLEKYQKITVENLFNELENKKIKELYKPIHYSLETGGKRLRPVLCLMACDLFGGNLDFAIKPALAIEYFHNFTLLHDDIMDSALLRRGKESVYNKYGVNTAILSGDAMMIMSYQFFEDLEPILYKKVVSLFTKTSLQICEGQQLDMNFAEERDISIDDYFEMITLKTGVLAAVSLQIGALVGGASEKEAQNLYDFGKHIGIAFQLMDDYLDLFGDAETIGKKHGGDIFENKKTILYLKALEKAVDKDKEELLFWYGMKTENVDKLYAVEKLFRRLDVDEDVEKLIKFHTERSLKFLEVIDISKDKKDALISLTNYLTHRKE